MTRTIFYTASSVDGFLATPDHSLDWLLSRTADEHGPMGIADFMAHVGALAMGSTTYRWILDHAGDWTYTVPAWVFTHRQLTGFAGADITFTHDAVPTVHAAMTEAAGDRDLWVVGGGDLAGQFADAGLLDEVVISYAPVTLGAGAPLLSRRLELRLTELARNGEFACARYAVLRAHEAPSSSGS